MHASAWSCIRAGIGLSICLVASSLPALAQQAAPQGAPALITGIELRREGDALQLRFAVSADASYEVISNPRKRVAVVKFRNARPAFPEGRQVFAYNDALIEGIVFEFLPDGAAWAKIRLRTARVAVEAGTPVASPSERRAVVVLRPAPAPAGIELLGVRLGKHLGKSRVVLDLEQLPQYDVQQEGPLFLIRLRDTAPGAGLRVEGEDDQLKLLGAEVQGRETLLRVQAKTSIRAEPSVLTDPPRVLLDFSSSTIAAAPAVPPPGIEVPVEEKGRLPAPEPLDELLAEVDNEAIRGTYLLAEREFRARNYASAANMFQRVFNAAPRARLGLRAFFRASDSTYESLRARNATNLHSVIASYQAAIRAAEEARYQSELIPRALFQIGRAYQEMGFYYEGIVHYDILAERFPDNLPYTPDSFYYRGESLLRVSKWDEAIRDFRRFLDAEGTAELDGPAFYNTGEAFYNQGDFTSARREFDQARRIAPSYAESRPVLLFHEGETYYENAEFATARQIYNVLLERYPDKPYTKLAALRLGDFLRDEGKEEDALKVYQQVITNAPQAIRLRGKLRIANIYASRPYNEDFRKALVLYDEVIKETQADLIAQEARLRRALTLTLHSQYREAIAMLEALRKEFPDSPYVTTGTIEGNIDENLKGLIDALFQKRDDWEIAKVYNQYRDKYFRDFRFKATLIQVADAYHRLGLYDEALGLYGELIRPPAHSLTALARYRIAHTQADQDELVRTEESLLRFIQDLPENEYRADARMLLGEIYARARRYADAVNAYRLVIQDFEKNPSGELSEAASEAYFRLGELHRELGQLKDAEESFSRAIENFHHPIQGELVPEFIVRAHFYIGDMRFELGRDAEALQAYQDAIARYPDHDRTPWAWYQTGLIYRRAGNDAKALETFNMLVDLAKRRPGELWEGLAKDNQRELTNVLEFRNYLNQ